MLKILGGDWPADRNAVLRTDLMGRAKAIRLHTGLMAAEEVALTEIASADIVTQENQASIAGKLGWGAAGGLLLGPVGLLAGVLGGGNRNMMVLAVSFRDGRKVLLSGKSRELTPLLGAGFPRS